MIDEYNNAANIRKKIVNTTKIKKKIIGVRYIEQADLNQLILYLG